MDFEEKMKLAVQMANFRIGLLHEGSPDTLPLKRQALPRPDTIGTDLYAQTVEAMLALIERSEKSAIPQTSGHIPKGDS